MTKFEAWLKTYRSNGDVARLLGWDKDRMSRVYRGKQPASLPMAKDVVELSKGLISYEDLLAHYNAKQADTNDETGNGETVAA